MSTPSGRPAQRRRKRRVSDSTKSAHTKSRRTRGAAGRSRRLGSRANWRRRVGWSLAGLAGLGVILVSLLLWWGTRPGPGTGKLVSVTIPSGPLPAISHQLQARGLVDSAWLFSLYVRVLPSNLQLEPGEHLILDSLAPRDLAMQLARLRNRQSTRVTLLEGWNHLEMATRLEAHGVCSQASFIEAVNDEDLLLRVSIDAESAEGYLFPDTYDFRVNSSAETIVVTLVQHAKRRLKALRDAHPKAAERLAELFGFDELAWVTLASILEKEAQNPRELPTIASVFFNRLTDPDFRPERMLQSDPTAAYGCLVEADRAESCANFTGKVLPSMLRDADNRYNTYKHAGLPPGPIANPGQAALLAVLKPEETQYLFFFADGNGNHTFTRSFDEHRDAIRRRRKN